MKIIGHRGAMGLAPENTLISIKKALESNVDAIEIDIRVSKDKVVLLHHDSKLINPIAGHLKIKDTNFNELKKYYSLLATLKEAINLVNFKIPLILEVKPKEDTAAIADEIKKIIKPKNFNNILIGSKSQSTLMNMHKYLPDIEKIVIESWSGVSAHYRARSLNTKKLFMNKSWLWSGFIRSVNRNGYELYPYTLNNQNKAKRWQKYGIAGIITDYPDRFKDFK
ncbi:MAG TPA: glycerophosphodiester phosphodiesterase [Patescibacteria group bacterium]|nr:glycerophosphodiester phosphodiesterase [Patescibacteria group bacterium]